MTNGHIKSKNQSNKIPEKPCPNCCFYITHPSSYLLYDNIIYC